MSSELKDYLISKHSDCISTVTDLSKNLHSNESSVTSDKQLFNFDNLVKKICSDNPPTSADAMYIDTTTNTITFIEFKGGFHDLISETTKDSSLIRCPKNNDIECNDYYNILMKKRQKEKENLKYNLICKIVETFVFYKYELFTLLDYSDRNNQNIKLNFLVVINDYVEEYEAELNEVAFGSENTENKSDLNNVINQIKQITKRFRNKNGRYYYHDVNACGVKKFKEKLEHYISL